MTPFVIRKERSGEVFTFLRRYGDHIQRERDRNGEIVEEDGKRVLYKKAGDDWF